MPRPGGTAQTRVAAKPRRQVFIRQGFESFAPGQRGMKAPAPRSVSLEARVARSHEQQRPLVRSLCAPAHISAPCPPHGQRCMLHRRSVLQVGGLPGIAGSQCQLGASARQRPQAQAGGGDFGEGKGGGGGDLVQRHSQGGTGPDNHDARLLEVACGGSEGARLGSEREGPSAPSRHTDHCAGGS